MISLEFNIQKEPISQIKLLLMVKIDTRLFKMMKNMLKKISLIKSCFKTKNEAFNTKIKI